MILAVIPARGGSKGIPRKNVKPFAGRPLIDWSIEAACSADLVDTVVVTSDDEEILRVARQSLSHHRQADKERREAEWAKAHLIAHRAGTTKPPRPPVKNLLALRRPARLATDEAATDPVLIHALGEAGPADIVVLLQPTSPLRARGLVDRVIQSVLDGAASAFTAIPGHFGWQVRDGQATCTAPRRPRRQDMLPEERLWLEDGSVYACRAEGLLQTGSRIFGRVEIVATDPRDHADLDEPWQWEETEGLYERRWRASREREAFRLEAAV